MSGGSPSNIDVGAVDGINFANCKSTMLQWAEAKIILSDPRTPDTMLIWGTAGNPLPNGIKFASSNIEQGARG